MDMGPLKLLTSIEMEKKIIAMFMRNKSRYLVRPLARRLARTRCTK